MGNFYKFFFLDAWQFFIEFFVEYWRTKEISYLSIFLKDELENMFGFFFNFFKDFDRTGTWIVRNIFPKIYRYFTKVAFFSKCCHNPGVFKKYFLEEEEYFSRPAGQTELSCVLQLENFYTLFEDFFLDA